MGFNSDTGLAVGTALDFTLPAVELAQESKGDASIVTSHEDLASSMRSCASHRATPLPKPTSPLHFTREVQAGVAAGSFKSDLETARDYDTRSVLRLSLPYRYRCSQVHCKTHRRQYAICMMHQPYQFA